MTLVLLTIRDWVGRFFKAWHLALIEGAPRRLRPYLSYWGPVKTRRITADSDVKAFLLGAESYDSDLEIDSSLTLAHTFSVPRAAVSDLKNVVALEAERVFPLSLDQLQLAHEITRHPDGAYVTLIAIRKSLISELEKAIARMTGRLRALYACTDDGRRISVSLPILRRRSLLRYVASGALALLPVAILTLAPNIYLFRLSGEMQQLDEAVLDIRVRTSGLADWQRQVRLLEAREAALRAEAEKGRTAVLLTALAALAPDSLVLDSIRVDRDRLYLSGRSPTPEEWVLGIQGSNFLKGARLTSVVGETGASTKRFEVVGTVVWPSLGEERQ